MRPIASQLTECRRMPKCSLGFASLGAVAGGMIGGTSIMAMAWQHITAAGVALGVCSSAVLGGLAGFLASSFYTVARGAWREALGDAPQKYKPR
jgi:hypothetical protein